MRRSAMSLIVGVLLGIAAVALMYFYVQSSITNRTAATAAPAVELGSLVVPTKQLPFGTTISKDFLKSVPWPKASIPQGAFTSIDEIFEGAAAPGDRIALVLIPQGEPVTRAKISGFGAKPTLSRQVESGKRAISIRVDDVVGVSGFVLPGDRVDIMLTRRIGAGADNLVTEILLQDIAILGVDQTADQASDKPIVARTATVAVTPEEAQKLALAQQAGTLSLALRGTETSTGQVATRPITERDLNGRERPVVQAVPPNRVIGVAPPPPATVRVRYGEANPVEKVVRP